MFRHRSPVRIVAAVSLLFALTAGAIGQEAPQSTPTTAPAPAQAPVPAPVQTHQMNKVMKSLTRYEAGTKLDVRLSDGSHRIGTVSETWPTYFVFVDAGSGKPQNIDYLDVSGVRPSGKQYTAHQIHRVFTEPGLKIGLVIVVGVLAVVAILGFRK